MNKQLVEIQPRELKFIVEVKKQSVCTVHLANVSGQYVAFKVKTTSPKKYCVRPNVGIIKPKSTCDFTVTMQAQKSASSEMQCKDKFLIQSTVVPFGTTEEEITSSMFAKESQKYIEETKLRVVLLVLPVLQQSLI
ncbi:UNVERIFIED_CONTAM: Vesicle-associated protein 2-2 [Sesamum radiatum]|uniref:Vesicle-associated protein 2-2 n=1 Tax=Sesamum radiatum TaxID=300843 RepID=A0AAW2S8H4_SESRA